jgi:hypothetical protein
MIRVKLKLRRFRRRPRRAKKATILSLAAAAAPARKKSAGRSASARSAAARGKTAPGKIRTVFSSDWVWPAIGILAFAEVILLGGHAVRWAMTSPRFVMDEVKIVGHKTLDPESLVKLSGLRPGTNIFGVDLERVRERIESNPWVRRSSVRKSPPSTLRIEIEERVPVALIDRKAGVAVDAEGVILGPLTGGAAGAVSMGGCSPLLKGFGKKGRRPGDRIESLDFAPALTAASLFSGAPVIRQGCLSVSRAGKGLFRLEAMGGKIEMILSEEKMAAQAARFHAVAEHIFAERNFSAAPVRLDLTFPGRIIVRPVNENGGLKG